MRIIRQRRRTSVQLRSRRRRRCPENGSNAANGRAGTVVSGGAGDRPLRSSKMSDPMYNILLGLVAVAAVVSITYYTTLTILPRAILAVGVMACIWGAMENFWGADELADG